MADILARVNEATTKFEAVQAIYNHVRRPDHEPKIKEVMEIFNRSAYSSGDEKKDYNLVSNYMSNIRKLEKEFPALNVTTRPKPSKEPRQNADAAGPPADGMMPTMDDLDAVYEAAEEAGGIEEFAETARAVLGVLRRVGSDPAKLETCISFWEKRAIKKK